jgi:hypothetical protein
MTYTDEQIEKAAAAIAHEYMQTTPYYIQWSRMDERGKKGYRKLARAALAAIEPLEPIEDVLLEGRYSINDIQHANGRWHCDLDQFDEHGNYVDEYWHGDGPTIDAAIRAAVAAAKGKP